MVGVNVRDAGRRPPRLRELHRHAAEPAARRAPARCAATRTTRCAPTDVYAQGESRCSRRAVAADRRRALGPRQARGATTASCANGDDSGSPEFSLHEPGARRCAGASRRTLNLYASVGRGFESPTLNELAYRPDGSSGFNAALQRADEPAVRDRREVAQRGSRLALDVALFRAETDDEIGVRTNAGGRSTFQNVGRTGASGAEASLRWRLDADAARAGRRDAARRHLPRRLPHLRPACRARPTVPVPAGNRIAGTHRALGLCRAGLAADARAPSSRAEWRGQAEHAGQRPQQRCRRRLRRARRCAARSDLQRQRQGTALEVLARIDNVTDRAYAGSVIVNEGNCALLRAGAPRGVLVGLRWRL